MLRTTALFALAGPFIGSYVNWLLVGLDKLSSATEIPMLFVMSYFLSIIFYPVSLSLGFIPAALTGLVYSYIENRKLLPSSNSCILNTMCGATLGFLFAGTYSLIMDIDKPHSDPIGILFSRISLSGAFAGAILSAILSAIGPTWRSTRTHKTLRVLRSV